MDSDPQPDTEVLDLRGLKCPLPALFAKRALLRTIPGTALDVIADDPLAALDIPHMCAQESFDVLSSVRESGFVRLRLRRPTVQAEGAPPSAPAAK